VDARAVGSVNARVCPDEQGNVSAKITLNISEGTDDPRAGGETIDAGGIGGSETFTMTLAAGSLSGPISSSGVAPGPPGATGTQGAGSATYTESADGKSGTLAAFGSSVPVSRGKFCTNGTPDG